MDSGSTFQYKSRYYGDLLFDSEIIDKYDRIEVRKIRPDKGVRGLLPDQTYQLRWLVNPLLITKGATPPEMGKSFFAKDKSISLSKVLMEQKGIDPKLSVRIVTKFKNGCKRDMRSANIDFAEALYMSSTPATNSCYQCFSRIHRKTIYVPKKDAHEFFLEYSSKTNHSTLLVIDGVLV